MGNRSPENVAQHVLAYYQKMDDFLLELDYITFKVGEDSEEELLAKFDIDKVPKMPSSIPGAFGGEGVALPEGFELPSEFDELEKKHGYEANLYAVPENKRGLLKTLFGRF